MKFHPPNRYISNWIVKHFPKGYRGWAVDVGASDGVSISSTYGLEHDHGWTVLCVEPNPEFHDSLIGQRAFVARCAVDERAGEHEFSVNLGNPEAYSALRVTNDFRRPGFPDQWKKITVKVERMEDLLQRWEFPKLDALCIDTEGTEDGVLKSLDLDKWRPRVVVIESWQMGKHDKALKGYERVERLIDNDLFVRREEP